MKTTSPSMILRFEAVLLLAAGVLVFHQLGGRWSWFAALFLVPDLAMLGYLGGRRLGAHVYNSAHTLAVPAALAGLGLLLGEQELGRLAAIWLAHIGFDRVLGYGLKYTTQFTDTHLGRV